MKIDFCPKCNFRFVLPRDGRFCYRCGHATLFRREGNFTTSAPLGYPRDSKLLLEYINLCLELKLKEMKETGLLLEPEEVEIKLCWSV